jgi:hypothetical protein
VSLVTDAPVEDLGMPFAEGNAEAGVTDASGVYGDESGTVATAGFANAFGMPFGFADTAFTFAGIGAVFENAGAEPVELVLSFDYDLVASVIGGGLAGDFGFAEVTASVFVDEIEELFFEAIAELGDGEVRVTGSETITLTLAAGDQFGPSFGPSVQLFIAGAATAVSVAPIPLPAGLPLLAAGLGALALLRRRAA